MPDLADLCDGDGAAVSVPVFALGRDVATVLGGVQGQARRERRWKGWWCQ